MLGEGASVQSESWTRFWGCRLATVTALLAVAAALSGTWIPEPLLT
ncbi:MAG: hypothetical protein U1E45_07805 [Geminicoccaceae bacterium]